jgi:non-specific serine/threonine protein kinase
MSGPGQTHNLPAPLTSFVGRAREIALVQERLAETRLLTLTGTGGAGKTRLALLVASNLAAAFDDGVWLVELAPLSDPILVPGAVAAALGLRVSPERPTVDALLDFLRPRAVLLVLDNCEHLVGACAELAGVLLRACPALRILATSREELNVAGEVTWRVPSLSLAADIAHSEAMQLFVERARASLDDFALSEDNAAAVAEVCQRLDGIPLAIELAAARVRSLAPAEIAARLDDRFSLLTTGPRSAMPRQQTLRATVEWSYALLAEEERRLFRGLSVFAGGWTLDAAEAICADPALPESGIFDLLDRLIKRSLVLVETVGAGTRYRLLETLRHYAADKASAAGEAAALADRHLAWFVALAEQAEPGIRTAALSSWLDRLEAEHDNIRAALRWAAERQPEAQVRLSEALWEFWYIRGHLAEGQGWLEAAAQRTDVPPRVRARALKAAGSLASYRYDFERAEMLSGAALLLAREIGDLPLVAACLINEANIDTERARYPLAESHYDQALAVLQELGDRYGIGLVLINRSFLARRQGQHERATALLEQCLPIFTACGDRRRSARALQRLGTAAYEQHDFVRAERLGREALVTFGELSFMPGLADAFELLAGVSAARGNAAHAARLFGVVEALQERVGRSLAPAERTLREHGLSRIRQALGDPAAKHEHAIGRALPIDQAIALAQSDAQLAATKLPPKRQPLSRREQEVLGLVAQGLTNRMVAERLVVSERTVDAQMRSVFDKLGLNSRAQAAVWAANHGLVQPPE